MKKSNRRINIQLFFPSENKIAIKMTQFVRKNLRKFRLETVKSFSVVANMLTF